MKKTLFLLFCILFSCSIQAQLTIVVDGFPNNAALLDPIYITGDFQSWDPASPAHQLTWDPSQNTYQITLAGVSGDINFKFTRGGWPQVESNEDGLFIPNRFHSIAGGETITLQIAGWEDLGGDGEATSTAADNVFILDNDFYMTELGRTRRVWIYLPPDYFTGSKSYPVLYMHDAQNVFDASTSFSGEWGVDETLNALHASGDPGIIVVAIDNGGFDRIDEYSAWPNASYGGGDGAKYIHFILDDLKPYIDATFRTVNDRDYTGIMGSSLGGLISHYAGIEHQEVFGKVGALSPSYWFNPEAFSHVSSTGKEETMRIYQLGGALEGGDMVTNMYAMQTELYSAGFGPTEVNSVEKSDGEHSEWFWAREFEAAYLWLFGTPSVGIEETTSTPFELTLYPNPAKDRLYLNFDLQSPGPVSLEIIDGQGRILRHQRLGILATGRQELEVKLAEWSLPQGIYFCRINGTEASFNKRFGIR